MLPCRFTINAFYWLAILFRLILSLWVNIICFSTYGKSLTIAAYTSHAGRIKVHNIQYLTSMYVYTSLSFLMYHRNTHRFCWNSMNRKADSGFSKFDNRIRQSLSLSCIKSIYLYNIYILPHSHNSNENYI